MSHTSEKEGTNGADEPDLDLGEKEAKKGVGQPNPSKELFLSEVGEEKRRVRFCESVATIGGLEKRLGGGDEDEGQLGRMFRGLWRERQGRDRWDADEVSDRLFVGAMDAAQQADVIKGLGVSHIVRVLARDSPTTGLQIDRLHYLVLRLDDRPEEDISSLFGRCSRFISKALLNPRSRVLVHCFMGVSRSVTLACAFLMKMHGCSAHHALEQIKRTRLEANPNPGFMQQLEEYEWQMQLQKSNKKLQNLRQALVRALPPGYRQPLSPTLCIVLLFLTQKQ